MSYVLPLSGSHSITLTKAIDMTSRFRSGVSTILDSSYQTALCESETFNISDILSLLQSQGIAGLRLYYGMEEDYSVAAILVGVDEEGNDILPDSSKTDDLTSLIVDQGLRCPNSCPSNSPLNS